MSLATTCPQCKTSFKVVPDQLKLRRGLVRCGMCRHVFSGVDFLRYVEEPAREARIPRSLLAQQTGEAHDVPDRVGAFDTDRSDSGFAPGDAAESPATRPPRSGFAEADADQPDSVGAAAEEAQPEAVREPATDRAPDADRELAIDREPATGGEVDAESERGVLADATRRVHGEAVVGARAGESPERELRDLFEADTTSGARVGSGVEPTWIVIDAAAPDEPGIGRAARESLREGIPGDDSGDDAVDFFATSRRARGFATRATVFAALAAFVLAITLPLQLAIGARDWLAAQLPALGPALAAAVAPLGLKVAPPRELDALTIESFELQSAGARSMLALNALLRNGAGHTLRWPAMELTLTDASGATAVRKVLLPEDYLGPAQRELAGIAAKAEWPVRVALRADGIEATGYSVKLFYH